jgi:hypothetical protein
MSYALIASVPKSVKATKPIQEELEEILTEMREVTKGSDTLVKLIANLRHEMESPVPTSSNHGKGSGADTKAVRNFSGNSISSTSWRNGAGQLPKRSSNENSAYASMRSHQSPKVSTTSQPVRYQSHFSSNANLEDKILNEIIGNKLNSFTPKTYDDTRDFIYQIIDSGETGFIRDFVEKVFLKATIEELYCGLFAKLIAEIAHKYPVMYEEINRYHKEFLNVFKDVEESSSEENKGKSIQKRQHRMGYGHFISELASLNALTREQLLAMVQKVNDSLMEQAVLPDRNKTVEEFIDCLTRLTQSLRDRSPRFFSAIKGDLNNVLKGMLNEFIDNRPVSMTAKARYGLMDLRDLVV